MQIGSLLHYLVVKGFPLPGTVTPERRVNPKGIPRDSKVNVLEMEDV